MKEMQSFLNVKYKLRSSDASFNDYLKFIGIGFIDRKKAVSITPTCTLTVDKDGYYTFTMSSMLRSVTFSFKPGEEFIEERVDGVKVKSTITFEGNKLIHVQIENNGRKSTHVREFTEKKLIVTTTAKGWNGKCVRVYARVK